MISNVSGVQQSESVLFVHVSTLSNSLPVEVTEYWASCLFYSVVGHTILSSHCLLTFCNSVNGTLELLGVGWLKSLRSFTCCFTSTLSFLPSSLVMASCLRAHVFCPWMCPEVRVTLFTRRNACAQYRVNLVSPACFLTLCNPASLAFCPSRYRSPFLFQDLVKKFPSSLPYNFCLFLRSYLENQLPRKACHDLPGLVRLLLGTHVAFCSCPFWHLPHLWSK